MHGEVEYSHSKTEYSLCTLTENGEKEYTEMTLPSVDKGKHGFDGQKCAHTASSPLTIRQVFSAGLSLSGHISAPAKLYAPASDGFSSDFWLLRRRRAESAYIRRCCRATFLWSEADARQGEKGKKRRKDALSGVFALVN